MTRHRQLVAIMFTDIEGYTALMQDDEQKAIDVRVRHRDIFETTTEKYNGTIVQYFGDGTLSTFKSTVEAVECAIEMQRLFLESPEIPVRIGIHVGDIIQTKDDIIGDAVNIASRIESGAKSGSILISDKVNDQLRSHKHIQTRFLDAYEFKNVEGTIPLFAIANEGLVIPTPDEVKGKLKAPSNIDSKAKHSKSKLGVLAIVVLVLLLVLSYFHFIEEGREVVSENSIAVLPFTNLSTDKDFEIFTDGMTEDILTNLSKLKDIHVISRTSMMQYKNTTKSIPEIAEELGVAYVLEGSIRKQDDQIRVAAQLIKADGDGHVWAQNYDKTLTDIFEIQSEVSSKIANALQLNLSFEEQQNFATTPTTNIDAYRYFLQGRKQADIRSRESIEKSITYYKKAIELDSSYAEAYAEIANSTFLQAYYGGANPAKAATKAESYLEKAESLNDKISRVYTVKGLLYNHSRQYDEARSAFQKAIKLSPNDVTARHQYATFFYYIEDYTNQLEQTKIAYSLDPLSFATASSYFTALTNTENYDEAERLIDDIVKDNPDSDPFIINRLYMRLYMAKPDYKKAIPVLQSMATVDNAYYRFLGYSYGKIGEDREAYRIIDSIKTLDKTHLKSHRVAVVFAGLQQKDSVLFYLDTMRNKSKRFNSSRITYFNFLKDSDAYRALLDQHGIEKLTD